MAGVNLEPGTVWLVGAGPGDPELLPLKAARALAVADVVLHDALVSPEILALASRARLELVGNELEQAREITRSALRSRPQLVGSSSLPNGK